MKNGKTINGLVYEKFGSTSQRPLVIFGGLNVRPNSGYFCNFPKDAEEIFGEVFVVYQEGVSGNLWRTGFCSEASEKRQLSAALELVGNREFVPLTHSISSILGAKLLNPDYRTENHAENVLPGVITSMYTSVKDALLDGDRKRRILGINALPLFQMGRYLPLPVPFYPLRDTAAHSKFGVIDTSEIACKWVNTRSADYCFKSENIVDSLCVDQKPIGFVTLQDRITSAEMQKELYEKLGAEVIEIDSGHRWMVDDESCDLVLAAIVKQLNNSP